MPLVHADAGGEVGHGLELLVVEWLGTNPMPI
jgi:hypothetical protein